MIILKNKEVSKTKKILGKYAQEIPIATSLIDGAVFIKGYRKYQYGSQNVRINDFIEEVDILFSGKIFVSWNGRRDWYSSELLNMKNQRGLKASKIKINRLIRKQLIKELSIHLNYFSVQIKGYSQIKKLLWK